MNHPYHTGRSRTAPFLVTSRCHPVASRRPLPRAIRPPVPDAAERPSSGAGGGMIAKPNWSDPAGPLQRLVRRPLRTGYSTTPATRMPRSPRPAPHSAEPQHEPDARSPAQHEPDARSPAPYARRRSPPPIRMPRSPRTNRMLEPRPRWHPRDTERPPRSDPRRAAAGPTLLPLLFFTTAAARTPACHSQPTRPTRCSGRRTTQLRGRRRAQ